MEQDDDKLKVQLKNLADEWLLLQAESARLKKHLEDCKAQFKPQEEQLAKLKKQASVIQKQLMEVMNSEKITSCNMGSSKQGCLIVEKKTSRVTRTKKHWQDGITDFLQEYQVDAVFADVEKYVLQQQKVVEADKLKLI
jgi:urease gamma subunit